MMDFETVWTWLRKKRTLELRTSSGNRFVATVKENSIAFQADNDSQERSVRRVPYVERWFRQWFIDGTRKSGDFRNGADGEKGKAFNFRFVKPIFELILQREADILQENDVLESSDHAISDSDETSEKIFANDISKICEDVPETEREAQISARIGQGRFRTEVLAKWENRCAVTGIDLTAAIRASHIKPWKDSSDKERLDPDNGLPLVATLDALFDVGLISFNDAGELLTSTKLSEEQMDELNLRDQRLSKKPNNKSCEHLTHHRRVFGFPT